MLVECVVDGELDALFLFVGRLGWSLDENLDAALFLDLDVVVLGLCRWSRPTGRIDTFLGERIGNRTCRRSGCRTDARTTGASRSVYSAVTSLALLFSFSTRLPRPRMRSRMLS